ncbi:SLC13 family permease [Herbaspirillum lusitanum]|jgi:Na+/H+ antiporter NhaD/arsenite permease-like protein|uniref:SLC13 family permease n=1 Tax=Herbaspirillum lusitanum TaxID=213312 RepID=A0ABW9AD18_9BURK
MSAPTQHDLNTPPVAAQAHSSPPQQQRPLRRLAASFLRDRLLHILLLLCVLLSLGQLTRLPEYPRWIEWNTICTLAGLMLLTKGIELSGYLDHIGRQLLARMHSERMLALFLVSASALLSTVLTNDIALFIVVPLTLGLRKTSSLPVGKLIIFEALAVNAGSLLTPIGNPQNILLWQQSHLSFAAFTWQMAPLAAAGFAVLLIATCCAFPAQQIKVSGQDDSHAWNLRQLLACALLYAAFVAAVESGFSAWGLLAVVLFMLLCYRHILLDVDWSLIAVFMLMFIDIHLLTEIGLLQQWLQGIVHFSQGAVFLTGVLGSQIISNVPATILLLEYLPAGKTIAYAVNAGGFGFVLGSLANLIALRMADEKGIWLRFHFYSVPLLAISAALAWLLLML